MEKRIRYMILFIILFITEVIIAIYVHDSFIRPYIGDVLVVPVVYCLIRAFIPEGFKRLPLYACLFAVVVEVLQYFQLADLLGLSGNKVMRIILGSTFDVKDLLCYAAGGLLIVILECYSNKK